MSETVDTPIAQQIIRALEEHRDAPPTLYDFMRRREIDTTCPTLEELKQKRKIHGLGYFASWNPIEKTVRLFEIDAVVKDRVRIFTGRYTDKGTRRTAYLTEDKTGHRTAYSDHFPHVWIFFSYLSSGDYYIWQSLQP